MSILDDILAVTTGIQASAATQQLVVQAYQAPTLANIERAENGFISEGLVMPGQLKEMLYARMAQYAQEYPGAIAGDTMQFLKDLLPWAAGVAVLWLFLRKR